MRFDIKTHILNYFVQFRFRVEDKKKYHSTAGCYDLTDDGVHRVLFLDYDQFTLPLDMLKAQLRTLQNMFKLSDFIILQTDVTSYHCICFDMLTTRKIEDIIDVTSCDPAFKNNMFSDFVPRVLRITSKGTRKAPKYLTTLKSKYNVNKKSIGHIKFYEQLLEIEIENKKRAVKTGLWGIHYKTTKV